jgi:hypothetical protein
MTPSAASAAAAPAINPRRTTGPRRAPATPPRGPRRVSGPANPIRNPTPHNPARGQTRGWAGPAHAVGLAEAVATHRLLDRLIRGRVWIGVIAFALIGIVTMQLVLLKLNAGIGRSLVRETLLQRENATLSAENSEVAAGEQVEAQAEHAGMELIPAGALRFLTAHPSADVSKAAAALSASLAGSATTTPGTTTTGESSSGAEAGATSSGASTETSGTGASSGTTSGTTSASATTGATTETGSATGSGAASTGASTGQASTEMGAGSTGETGAAAAHPVETASPSDSAGASAAGASEAASTSAAPTSTGGSTPGG